MLGRAYSRHELWLVYLKVDPVCDNLRTDPRFQPFLHRVGDDRTLVWIGFSLDTRSEFPPDVNTGPIFSTVHYCVHES